MALAHNNAVRDAARLIAGAEGIIVTAGAGMGVDSGLPDFRGQDGFWNAYPALKHEGYSFYEIASPKAFCDRPRLAWGFYGHRLSLYRSTKPHAGFDIIARWGGGTSRGAFVFTSNVDGHFQKAGFPQDRVVECHGSIHELQCLENCIGATWSADLFDPVIGDTDCRLIGKLPMCPQCGALARPNILMFEDTGWAGEVYEVRREALDRWTASVSKIVVVEIGVGTSIPTVRRYGERVATALIRINSREAETRHPHAISLQGNALNVLLAIDSLM